MLPSRSPESVRLAEVLTSCLSAVSGSDNRIGLPSVDSAIVLMVDGLGVHNLKARHGHARTLSAALGSQSVALTTFPSTTATALTTLTTGVEPGDHGIVGYSIIDRATRQTLNQISGWGSEMPPATWQRAQTVFEQANGLGLRADVIAHPKYAGSGFTQAVLRGAEFLPATSIQQRLELACERASTPGVSYVYAAELDMAAHAEGWESERWLARLEEVDAALRAVLPRLPKRTGLIVTADHGIVDVPAHRQIAIDQAAPDLLAPVIGSAGDPRALSLWLETGTSDAERQQQAQLWQQALGDTAWALSREQAIDAALYGPTVSEEVLQRIGDVLLLARKSVAFYDFRTASPQSRAMIGQHGSLSDEEVRVPLLRYGAFG